MMFMFCCSVIDGGKAKVSFKKKCVSRLVKEKYYTPVIPQKNKEILVALFAKLHKITQCGSIKASATNQHDV